MLRHEGEEEGEANAQAVRTTGTEGAIPQRTLQPDTPILTSEQRVLDIVDQRIAEAKTNEEADFWLKKRAELVPTQEQKDEIKHRRRLDWIQESKNLLLSFSALGVGTFLEVHGITYPGMFVLGCGLASTAPEIVKAVLQRENRKNNSDDAGNS